jgi:hypothetical protein
MWNMSRKASQAMSHPAEERIPVMNQRNQPLELNLGERVLVMAPHSQAELSSAELAAPLVRQMVRRHVLVVLSPPAAQAASPGGLAAGQAAAAQGAQPAAPAGEAPTAEKASDEKPKSKKPRTAKPRTAKPRAAKPASPKQE